MMTIAEFVYHCKNEYNGHKQTTLTHMDMDVALQLCKDLEGIAGTSFVLEVWTDGCMTIYQKDFWGAGEHHLGHTDRTILSIGE